MEKPEQTSEEENEKKHRLLLEEREKKFKPTSHFSYYAFGVLILTLIVLFFIGVVPRLSLKKKLQN